MNKIKVFEAFAGYGSQSIALRNLGIDYEVVAISEIDKYAIQAYEAIHGPTLNLGDISKIKVEDIPQHDLFTYSFPCQDLSVAGKQAGLIKGQTRSGLLYECEKIIEHCRPKYLLMENVKNLVGKKFRPQFYEWLRYLKGLGYTNYAQVLNAKDYGVPQNRERVFVVSILGEHKPYKFPKPIPLDKCIADILEDEVDEKYYLSEEIQKRFKLTNQNENIVGTTKPDFRTIGQRDLVYNKDGIMGSLVATDYKQPKQILEINLPCIAASRGRNPENPSDRTAGAPTEQRLEFNTKGTSNTITTVQKDNYVVESPSILRYERTEYGKLIRKQYEKGEIKEKISNMRELKPRQDGISNTITTVQKDNYLLELNYRIRKLTPRECFRLMGMREDDIAKIQQAGISNTQQYKMAGNSIVVNVLEAIFRNLFK